MQAHLVHMCKTTDRLLHHSTGKAAYVHTMEQAGMGADDAAFKSHTHVQEADT